MPPSAPSSTVTQLPRQRTSSERTEPIPGMKAGWSWRPADRTILHRASKDLPATVVGIAPRVTGVVTHLTDDGEPIRTEYQVLGKRQRRKRILTEDELDRGTWAAKLGMPRPSGNDARLAFAAVIRRMSEEAPEIPARTYYNEAGDLILPDADAQPFGYLTCAGTEENARKVWEEIGAWAILDPKAALVLGATFVGPVLDSLGTLAHILNLTGPGQQGKSTQLVACAATLGNIKPRAQKVMMTWNASKQGITQSLRQRGFLPVLLDEHSSSGRAVKESSREFSQIVAGAVREMGTADGSPRESDGFWWSVLVSSSNDPLKYQGQSEDLATRLQELPAPFWPNLWVNAQGDPADPASGAAEHLSKRIKRLVKSAGGWPLAWAVASGTFRAENLARIKARHLELCAKHGPHVGGIPDTIAEIYMAWVVGAEMLGAAIEVPEIGAVALSAALWQLGNAVQEAAEANTPDGELLWLALDAMRIEASAYPPMDQVAKAAEDGYRKVKGFTDPDAGHWWVVNPVVQEAAAAAGLDNLGAALRYLDEHGVHIRGKGKDAQRKLPHSLRGVVGERMHCFDVRRAAALFAPDDESEGGQGDPGATKFPRGATPGATPGATQVAPGNMPSTCTGATGATGATLFEVDSHTRDGGLRLEPLPPSTDSPVETGPESEEEQENLASPSHDAAAYPTPVERVTDPVWSKLRRNAAAIGVLSTEGLHLPNHEVVPMALPTSVDDVVPLMQAYQLRTLYLHQDVIEALSLPDLESRRAKGLGPESPDPHSWATPAGDSPISAIHPAGLSTWMTLKLGTDPQQAERLNLAVPAYDDRFDKAGLPARGGFGGAQDGATLLDAVMVWTLSTLRNDRQGRPQVVPYFRSPNKTGEELAGGQGRTDITCQAIRERAVPPAFLPSHQLPIMVPPHWHRSPTENERMRRYLHRYDKTAAWLGAFSNVGLGIGEPQHATGDLVYDPKCAGYWRVLDVPGTGLPGLPEFKFTEAEEGGYWLLTPSIDLLKQIYPAWHPQVVEAWYWPETKRALSGMYERLNNSRAYILDAIAQGRPGAKWAKQLNGRIYQSFRGYLTRSTGPKKDFETGDAYGKDIYYRPDWARLILELACCNTYRALMGFAQSGHYPLSLHVDAATYASDEADPLLAKPASMVIGDKGGNWTVEGTAPMAEVLALLNERTDAHRALDAYLDTKED